MDTTTISQMDIRARWQYVREQLAFDGSADDVDGYINRENITAMFGECDLSDEDIDDLRNAAAWGLSE